MNERLNKFLGEKLENHPDLLDEMNSLAGSISDGLLPFLDRETVDESTLSQMQKDWRKDGVVILNNFIPEPLIEAYRADWIQHNRVNHDRPLGYPGECAYYQVPSLMNISTFGPLQDVMRSLIGEPMGVHLNLTGWKSTQRNWHQDGYLNPDSNYDHYLAIWVALDDIHEDSGPFEYVRGSHVLPIITQDKTLARLEESERRDPLWPKYSERFLTPMFEDILNRGELEIEKFLAKKGDVLLWHARLMHRGSIPNNPDLWRETAILHYSGVNHRPDMPSPAIQHQQGGWYFPLNQNIPL
tara:strand:- start:7876 stop:8769 length:894 start_codon:yes stop_codon:yes gene_type:complete